MKLKLTICTIFQLIAAIAPDLKRKAFGSTVPDLLGATSEYCQLEDRTIVLTKFRCKNYYSLFIEKIVSEPSAVRAWSFSEIPNWSDCFANIYKSSKDNKLRQFTCKVVHRIITTKKELLKYKLASDDKCPFCLNPDSIEHTFLYCQESKEFFSKTLRWLNKYHKENVQLSHKQILFNTFDDFLPMQMPISTQRKLRLLVLLQKKYLYT